MNIFNWFISVGIPFLFPDEPIPAQKNINNPIITTIPCMPAFVFIRMFFKCKPHFDFVLIFLISYSNISNTSRAVSPARKAAPLAER